MSETIALGNEPTATKLKDEALEAANSYLMARDTEKKAAKKKKAARDILVGILGKPESEDDTRLGTLPDGRVVKIQMNSNPGYVVQPYTYIACTIPNLSKAQQAEIELKIAQNRIQELEAQLAAVQK